jgi:hypothetical protein
MGSFMSKDLIFYNKETETINASLLPLHEYNKIAIFIKCTVDEKILILNQLRSPGSCSKIRIGEYGYIGVTNLKLFKIYINGDIVSLKLDKLDRIVYQYIPNPKCNNFNHAISCVLKSGEKKTYDMRSYKSCKFFCDQINLIIMDLNPYVGLNLGHDDPPEYKN